MSTEHPPTPEQKPVPDAGPMGEPSEDGKQMAMLCHLLGALVGILGAVILWVVKKDEDAFVDDQGKEATNFHLTLLIGYIVTAVVGTLLSCVTFGLSGALPLVVWIVQIVLGIIASLEAKKGVAYRYPICIRFIS